MGGPVLSLRANACGPGVHCSGKTNAMRKPSLTQEPYDCRKVSQSGEVQDGGDRQDYKSKFNPKSELRFRLASFMPFESIMDVRIQVPNGQKNFFVGHSPYRIHCVHLRLTLGLLAWAGCDSCHRSLVDAKSDVEGPVAQKSWQAPSTLRSAG
jgi:hypothetical protein